MQKYNKHILSKSTIIRGIQCVKSLYLNKHNKDLREDISEQLKQVFNTGHQVGELAQDLFPNGEYGALPNEIPSVKSVIRTQELIEKGVNIIYEATFQFNDVMVAMDILVKENGVWKAYEVKSSTSVKDTFVLDASVQYYVITKSGVDLADISIVHINNQYIKQGDIDIHKLFSISTVLDEVIKNQEYVSEIIDEFKEVLNLDKVPEIEIGPHCFSPYNCDFAKHCWKNIPKETIFSYKRISGVKKWELFNSRIYKIEDIPSSFYLNNTENIIVSGIKENKPHINKPAIKSFISSVNYPIYYLDFETLYMVTIPIFDNSRPFQQIPFQYSLHIKQNKNAKVEHKDFLAVADRNIDPRYKFIEQLISEMGNKGSVMVYNATFEIGRLKEIKELLPQYSSAIDNIISRVVDLMDPFRSAHYITPSMNGSYSIKQVLPALVPELSYKTLDISDGGEASSSFMRLFDETDINIIDKTRSDLLKYCELDTLAMLKIFEVLEGI